MAINGSSGSLNFVLALVGDAEVGKSELTKSITGKEGDFSDAYHPTVGANFFKKIAEEEKVKCDIWDKGGSPRYHDFIPLYCKGADAILLVFDLSRRESFDNLAGRIQVPSAILINQ